MVRKKKPINPLVDEESIVSVLRSVPQLETLPYFRRAAVMAVMDAFDRGVSRDFFASILSNCVNMNEVARRMEMVQMMRQDLTAQTLTVEKLDEVSAALIGSFEQYRHAIAQEAFEVSEMPQANDVIH